MFFVFITEIQCVITVLDYSVVVCKMSKEGSLYSRGERKAPPGCASVSKELETVDSILAMVLESPFFGGRES